ncbi:histamine N-methyltransferase-like isoform X2 [Ptychodera flava]|uniref:histamine N-methyltransferase-like isoform X2 n=1 Tax=Ptychodera flava TaxID=63121 RepID=UPI00396A1ADA
MSVHVSLCPRYEIHVYSISSGNFISCSRSESANDAMAAANLKSIYDDMDYYFETFEVFKKAVNLDYIMEQWHKQWPVIIDSIDFEPSGDEAFRMMTVGSGEGDVESNIFPYILKRHPKLHVCVIEPSPESVALFKKKASKLQETHPGVTFEWHVKTLEQYQDEEASDRFHLVLSGHSLYYIEKWGAAVNTMYGFVRKGGNLVITICNGESPAGRLLRN